MRSLATYLRGCLQLICPSRPAGAILEAAQAVLATLFSPGAAPSGAQPPFSAAQLDGSEGSGAALEDWVQVGGAISGGSGRPAC